MKINTNITSINVLRMTSNIKKQFKIQFKNCHPGVE